MIIDDAELKRRIIESARQVEMLCNTRSKPQDLTCEELLAPLLEWVAPDLLRDQMCRDAVLEICIRRGEKYLKRMLNVVIEREISAGNEFDDTGARR